ncbi:MAG TPA: alpha/beta hydrolase [Streptosporangiaceae bacterium]|jgi:3-oxoadipate enol-lactonase|nr:alpha/beta hydrolase [Streptosporangiaceae bacterium]
MTELRLVRANGIQLAYRESGSPATQPLLLLHALGENSADWDQVAAALAASWHVYALDLRGHGRSDWPGTYTLALLRDDVLAFLDALKLPQVTVIGHSMGGAAAYLAAMRQPERVRRLILEEPAPPWPRVPRSPVRPPGPLPFDWAVTTLSGEASDPPASSRDGLAEITAPTLVIAGGPDSHVSQDRLADMAALIPGGQLITIPAGHLVHAAQPARFISAVTAFLAEGASPVDPPA